jgi:GntR family transcriptional regulator
MPTIDPRADRPVYKQLADEVRRMITDGELAAGDAIPSEPELSDKYGISRTTVRQGLSLLTNEGLVQAQHGRGWYVRAQRPVRRMADTRYQAELDQIARPVAERDSRPFTFDHRGYEKFELKRRLTEVAATGEIAEVFQVPDGTMLLRREFTFIFDGEPHRKSWSYLLLDMVKDTPITDAANEPWPGGTMAQLDSVGVRVTAVDEIVRARMPTPEETAELRIDSGTPVLAVRRVMYAETRPVEACVDIVIPADRVVLHYHTELHDPVPAG